MASVIEREAVIAALTDAWCRDRNNEPAFIAELAEAVVNFYAPVLREREEALASKIGPDWREALPYESELELKAALTTAHATGFAAGIEAAAKEVNRLADIIRGLPDDRHDGAFVALTRAAAALRHLTPGATERG
jgi:hypothetical protein